MLEVSQKIALMHTRQFHDIDVTVRPLVYCSEKNLHVNLTGEVSRAL
jgi:hypothetical protein